MVEIEFNMVEIEKRLKLNFDLCLSADITLGLLHQYQSYISN